MKKIKKLKFTLMEVTVAFGIFAVLVAVLMQFLNTAQRSWNLAEKRARAYADSRVLFDLVEKSLQTAHSSGFYLNTGSGQSEILFPCVLPYRYPLHDNNNTATNAVNRFLDQNLRKVRNLRVNFNGREIRFIYPELGWSNSTPSSTNPDVRETNGGTYDLSDVVSNSHLSHYITDVILENIVSFNVSLIEVPASGPWNVYHFGSSNSARANRPRPNFVNISIQMFGSDEDYAVWRSLPNATAQQNYFTEHGFSFNRLISLPTGR